MARADRGVALEIDAPLASEFIALLLLEVGVDLNLVNSGLDAASCDKVGKHRHYTVADANRLAKTSIDKGLHFAPNDVVRRGSDVPILGIPVDDGADPVDKVKVNVVELQLAEGLAAGALNVVVAVVPELGCDEKL